MFRPSLGHGNKTNGDMPYVTDEEQQAAENDATERVREHIDQTPMDEEIR
ncbi:hypothetical protein [Arenimonas composti]|nr:hypothetical protein [Arenimonas composti]